ncbi:MULTISPECIES: GNAT family N-acetyltransferase [unclassified Virgibacillus]|uniref:GNAT family N-acetyltransferase n=1 Tax=unclassified Virgibacillus TaxID=2620237 RepID=UPI0024DE8293|nr:GNAT family N-acetyltransferase [Virgibacillus sp. LDC-1]
MKWHIKSFADLTNNELYHILKARVDIFVVEQACPYPELDNYDQQSIHYYLTDGEQLVAYVRILPAGYKYKEASIGRVIVNKSYRGKGIGKKLMQNAVNYTTNNMGEKTIKIQAQSHLEAFYSSLGFRKISAVYLDDGIPHIDMRYEKK